jgi:hypothetical protein
VWPPDLILRIATPPRVRTTSVACSLGAVRDTQPAELLGAKRKTYHVNAGVSHHLTSASRQLSATRGTAPPENATSCTPSTSSGVPDRSSDHPLRRDPLRTSISHRFSASMHFGNSALSAKRAPRTLRFPSASHPLTCRGLGSFLEVASRLRSVLAAPSCPVPQDMLVASMMCT